MGSRKRNLLDEDSDSRMRTLEIRNERLHDFTFVSECPEVQDDGPGALLSASAASRGSRKDAGEDAGGHQRASAPAAPHERQRFCG
jgi:hypothetical protein